MSERTLSVWVGPEIIYLYGTANGIAATFTVAGDGCWQAVVPRSEDDNYDLYLEAYSTAGLEGIYSYTLFYGMMPGVTDRSAADVKNKTAKGYYNTSDLNRVGHNVQYLASLLVGYGYSVSTAPREDWSEKDIPCESDMAVYLGDVVALKNRFYGSSEIPTTMRYLDYIQANRIEILLAEVEEYIKRMETGFRYSGTFYCGQTFIL